MSQPQDFLRHLPQTLEPGEFNLGEAKAYELALGYPMARGLLPPFLKGNSLTEAEIVLCIKFAVVQGDHHLIMCAAYWLALSDGQKVKLKERLERELPDLF